MISKRIPLFINNEYPLWLTRSLLMYVGKKNEVDMVDWIKSKHNCLIINKKKDVETIKNMKFFYPDGTIFDAHTDEEMEFIINEEDEFDEPQDGDYWYDDHFV
ncbi:lef-6 [Cryptophlebia leucotreta granulovirus]|uniref:Lef-6 n=1 Tax=Cryptophlebia leucotreta granulosis virus TaxID=35254 RepID=Q7T5L8_GVCL|nr:lef-6 [Cryptophlebia leucotreta granulovirus]AAQ21666.1 lef-6 [Cryptophlebia leucotreta granulovirus]